MALRKFSYRYTNGGVEYLIIGNDTYMNYHFHELALYSSWHAAVESLEASVMAPKDQYGDLAGIGQGRRDGSNTLWQCINDPQSLPGVIVREVFSK